MILPPLGEYYTYDFVTVRSGFYLNIFTICMTLFNLKSKELLFSTFR